MRDQLKKWQKTFWPNFLISGIEEEDTLLFSRTLFAKAILIVMSLLHSSFVIYHLIFTHQYGLGILNLAVLLFVLFLLIQLMVKKSIKLVGQMVSIGTIPVYFLLILTTQNENMSFIWVVFFPFFVILLNGWKVGLPYVLTFYLVLFPLAYMNIGVWDNGDWNFVSFYRLLAVLILGLCIAVLIDLAQVYAHSRELKLRQKERKYMDKLEIMSITDGLTGLYNRRYFNQVFTQKIAKIEESQQSLLFFIVDIDYFKAYNDHYGHQAGDEVIKRIAKAMKHYMQRENDLVFRLGGEEFGGLLEAREPQQMENWLMQLADVIEDLKIPHAPGLGLPYVTISGGVSFIQGGSNTTMNELYRKADKALYQAKQQGRNQFVTDAQFASDLVPNYDKQQQG